MRFFLISLVTSAATLANGHAALMFPISRNVEHKAMGNEFGAAGSGVCGGTGGQWDDSNKAKSQLRDTPFPSPKQVLLSGQALEIEIQIMAAHGGAMVLELCANPAETITNDCFVRLQRDPNDLRGGQYFPDYPEYFFPTKQSCSNITRQRFLLPEGLETEHGILRWGWATGNSKTARNFMKQGNPLFKGDELTKFEFEHSAGKFCKIHYVAGPDTQPAGDLECPLHICEGEHFFNCADVSIEPFAADPYTLVVSKQGTEERPITVTESRYDETEPAVIVPVTDEAEIAKLIAECVSYAEGNSSAHTEYCKELCEGSVNDAVCVSQGFNHGIDCLTGKWVNVCHSNNLGDGANPGAGSGSPVTTTTKGTTKATVPKTTGHGSIPPATTVSSVEPIGVGSQIVEHCKKNVRGIEAHNTDSCKAFCDASENNAWCNAMDMGPGLDCVVSQWELVCTIV